ncbi:MULTISPECIES: tyrosine-protein phosphatase [Actinomadura]|uniref:Tyrosine-protein phosphatase n=1 Tax=Actinomadura yumaensis TaxID=111807 RepID=A0ABW2D325_9ACTN|nr:tyrosine-protein phosphatase [Actinomadura sp. J1-007]MWK39418.1 protein-tyrosine-phosphatase [Actinomadura sp. J1-007]
MKTSRIGAIPVAGALFAAVLVAPPASAASPASPAARVAAGSVFASAAVTRNADGTYTVGWQAPDAGTISVAAVTDPADPGPGRAVGSGGGTGSLTVSGLPSAPRWYFRLAPANGSPLVVADRSLHLAHARNFRDVGGYRTADGHWVRMGVFYRSNKLSELDAADLDQLAAQRLKLIVDLRNGVERRDDPDRIPAGASYKVADLIDLGKGLPSGPDLTAALLLALPWLLRSSKDAEQQLGYRLMVNAPSARAAYRDLLTSLAATPGGATAVFHCTAGKDRTGWGAVVLLTLLGVDRRTIADDYLASNTYYGADSVRANWLDAAYAEVDRTYGSFDAYVRKGLGLPDSTVAALRARMLAP